jgi:hypothetical protein
MVVKFGRKPCPTLSVPVMATLLSVASLLGGIIEDCAPPPFALGENLGQRRHLGVAPFLKALPWSIWSLSAGRSGYGLATTVWLAEW